MADLFDEKAADWDAGDMKQQLSRAIGAAIVAQVPLNAAMNVMDFGAGTGLICSHIAPKVHKITAVDISPAMLTQLAAKPELQGKVETVCQDILAQPLSRQFDLIVSAMAMHHVSDTKAMLQSFAQHLKSGAQVALADLDEEDGTFHPADAEGVYHAGFNQIALQKLLEHCGFIDISFQIVLTVAKEGKEYPVFLVVATKV